MIGSEGATTRKLISPAKVQVMNEGALLGETAGLNGQCGIGRDAASAAAPHLESNDAAPRTQVRMPRPKDAGSDTQPQACENAEITVIVVSDFEVGEKDWHNEERMALALAAQDIDQPIHVLFVETEANRAVPPPAKIRAALPNAQFLYFDTDCSAGLKDRAAQLCTTPFIAVLESDCTPEPDWLRRMAQRAKSQPEHACFSGRTHYGNGSAWERVLNLIDRSFDDQGECGETPFLSNNAAFYRGEVLKRFPYPDAPTTFVSAWLRINAMLEAGYRCYSDRDALVRHALEGFPFFWDLRRQTGFACYTMHGNRGWRDIPRLLRLRLNFDLENVRRVGPKYLKLRDWPLWFALSMLGRVPETLGMIAAMQAKPELRGTSFR